MNDTEDQNPAQERRRAPRVRESGNRPTGERVDRDPQKAALYQVLARALFSSEHERGGGDADPQDLVGKRKEEWEAVKNAKVRQARRLVRTLEKRGKVKIEFVGEVREKRRGEAGAEEETSE